MNYRQFLDCGSLQTLELQSAPICRELWPRLLEKFLKEGNGILAPAGIPSKQCIAIAWNFMCANTVKLCEDGKKPSIGWKRGTNIKELKVEVSHRHLGV
mmetsp:Transcript_19655/g.46689  ORF Transcript_19655/g.46689 Transcript_19655/m.46689 type:complete len:99 (-) Transcript_19655:116-412(-)